MLEDLATTLEMACKVSSSAPSVEKLPWCSSCFRFLKPSLSLTPETPLQHQAFAYAQELISVGRMLRQEATTLVPAVLLKLSGQHSVLDLCAGPGVRALQVLEYLNTTAGAGFLVANVWGARNARRFARVLAQHGKSKLLVTEHDPVNFPLLKFREEEKVHAAFTFDRVLCFVPSSCDGNLKKSAKIWQGYHWKSAYKLHRRQVAILAKSIELVKVGERTIYTVSSMNPIEGEAVVAEVISRLPAGTVRVLDVDEELKQNAPGLKFRHGKKRWKVLDLEKRANWYKKWEETPESARKYISKSLFCSPYIDSNWEGKMPKKDPMNIHKCIRIYPHDQNTTGLFVAVLEKTKNLSTTIYDDFYELDPITDPRVKQHSMKAEGRFMNKWLGDLYASEEEKAKHEAKSEALFPRYKRVTEKAGEVWSAIEKEYGIQPEFKSGQMYYFHKSVNKLFYLDPAVGAYLALRKAHRLRIRQAGQPVFKRRDRKGRYCLLYEGLATIFPYLDRRVIRVKKEILDEMLKTRWITLERLKGELLRPEEDTKELTPGCAVLCATGLQCIIWIGMKKANIQMKPIDIQNEVVNSKAFGE